MKYGNKKPLIILTLAVFTVALCQKTLAEKGATSEQVKIGRHMAQAYLSAGAQKKQATIEETEHDRKRLQSALTALDELTEVVNISIEPVSSKLEPTVSMSFGKNNINNTGKKTRKLIRINRITNTKQKLNAIRTSIEDELPRPWEFWKENTRNNERKQEIAGLLNEVENALDKPEQINHARLKELKNRLTINKHEARRSYQPTIRILNSKPQRAPLPVRVTDNTGK